MASQYFAILTDYGTRAIAHALSQGQPLQLTQFAVGDGNGQTVTPTASATALVHQTHIAPVSAVSLDPRNNKQVIVELTIPENVGGFYIREMGVFDSQNKLIAYANCPESFKPTESSGSGKVQVLRMILKIESSSAVTLSIDNSVIFVTRQQMAPKTITATTQNGFDESGHSHEIAKASTTQQGIVQLTNDTGLESESLALTAKAGKKLAQLIATVQLALNNYIPLNKRSSAVNSNDENNVATSKAVKTAYDKGTEAKNAADNAQRTADSKQSPATTLAGYGIGNFKIEPFVGNLNTLKTDGVYAITQASRSQNLPVSTSCHIQVISGGDEAWCRQLAYVAYSTDVYERHQTSYQTDSWSDWVKIDSLDKIPNSKKSSAVNSESEDNVATSKAVKIAYDKGIEAKTAAGNAQRSANDGINRANNAQLSANNANNNANGRVSKSGDTMTGALTALGFIANSPTASVMFRSTTALSSFLDFAQKNTQHALTTLESIAFADNAAEFRMHLTPQGHNNNTDRREHTFTFQPGGNIWSKKFGWFDQYFGKKPTFTYYQNHYLGASVYKIPFSDTQCLKITLMLADHAWSDELILPEIYNGQFLVNAIDAGGGTDALGAFGVSNNRIKLLGDAGTRAAIFVFGEGPL